MLVGPNCLSDTSAQFLDLPNTTDPAWPAVKTQQSSGVSGDLAFVLSVRGAISQAPLITKQPVGTNVVQGRPFVLSVVATGVPAPSYQWFKDGLAILDATNATYFVSFADPTPGTGHSGQYQVRLTNPAGRADSATVSVTVTPDTEGPILLYGALRSDGTVHLAWSEVMSNSYDYYSVFVYDPNGSGEFVGFRSLTMEPGGTDLILTPYTNLVIGIDYDIFIGAGAFRDQFGNVFLNNDEGTGGIIRPLFTEVTVADYSTPWSFDCSGADLITNSLPFYLPGFDDSAWPTGRPPFGTEPEIQPWPSIVTWVPRPPAGPITTYYRLRFRVCCGGQTRFLQLGRVRYDDGFVAYLDGVEVARAGVPAHQNAHSLATSRGANPSLLKPLDLPLTHLVDGEHVLAVELHQASTNDHSGSIWACEVVAFLFIRGGNYSPEITGQTMGPLDVSEGDRLTLAVSARGTGALFYQWSLDGTLIAGATNQSYSVSAATPAEAGSYVVRVHNMFGSEESAPVAVRVISVRVGITLDGQGQIILEHNGAEFGAPCYVQETTVLAAHPADTHWTTRPSGPHGSPYNAGPARGTRFFRLSTNP